MARVVQPRGRGFDDRALSRGGEGRAVNRISKALLSARALGQHHWRCVARSRAGARTSNRRQRRLNAAANRLLYKVIATAESSQSFRKQPTNVKRFASRRIP